MVPMYARRDDNKKVLNMKMAILHTDFSAMISASVSGSHIHVLYQIVYGQCLRTEFIIQNRSRKMKYTSSARLSPKTDRKS